MNSNTQHAQMDMVTKTETDSAPRLLTAKQAAQAAGLSTRSVYRLQASGDFPPALKVGGSVRWRRDILDRWINANCPKWQKFTQIYGENGEKPRK